MIKMLLKYKWYIALIIALMIIEPSINSALNFWLQKIFNSATPGADKLVVFRFLTTGFLLWMLKRIVTFTSSVLKNRFICNAKQDVKHKIFVKLLKLDTANISETTSSGEYISVFTNDIALIEQRFFNQVLGLCGGVFSLIILGASFIALNAKLATAIIGFGVITMFVPLAFSKMLNERNLTYSSHVSKLTQKLKEYFVAYPTIKNYSIEEVIVKKFDEKNQETEDAKFEADYALSLANNVGMLLSWFMQFIGVGLGIMLVIKGEILIGTVIASQSFASDLAQPLQDIIINFNSIRSVKDIVIKIETLALEYESEDANTKKAYEKAKPIDSQSEDNSVAECDIRFENLELQIGGKKIIDHFTFDFQSGKKYLVVGLNGSGKSSIFKALKKWFRTCSGFIYVNDRNIADMSSEEKSKTVSYLNENVSLFSGSIRDNISLFRTYTQENFDKAIQDAHIELDLDREIVDEGRNVSSGEQRRIEIARSLIESVRVLIFDEVVSTLDIETAYEIEKLALGFDEKTVIFISHNFSGKLIKEYDEILVMENGTLLSHGTYDELINNCEYFRRICDIKFGANCI